MMRNALLAGASALALSVVPAAAFNEVDWTWDLDIDDTYTGTFTVEFDGDFSGLVTVEKLQWLTGDVTATSNVSDITFEPTGSNGEGGEGGPTEVDFFVVFDSDTTEDEVVSVELDSDDGINFTFDPASGELGDCGADTPSNPDFSCTDPFDDFVAGTITVTDFGNGFTPDLTVEDDLATIDASTIAIGNNQSISSEVATSLHDAQFVTGELNFADADLGDDDNNGDSDFPDAAALTAGALSAAYENDITNTSLLGALALAMGAGSNVVDQSQISATSNVSNVTQARIEASATALANNMSFDLDARTADDTYLQADLAQVAFADVSAETNVDTISITGFAGMGDLGMDMPAINASATAIGNNLSINVEGPDVDTGGGTANDG